MPEIKLKKRYKCARDILQALTEHAGWSVEDAMTFVNSIKDARVELQREVAREIFEEIWKCMEHDYISSIDVYSGALSLRIAELKKKYTEESQ